MSNYVVCTKEDGPVVTCYDQNTANYIKGQLESQNSEVILVPVVNNIDAADKFLAGIKAPLIIEKLTAEERKILRNYYSSDES